LDENIFDPIGMVDTRLSADRVNLSFANSGDNPNSSTIADLPLKFSAAGLTSTSTDMARWLEALFADELMSQESRDLMFGRYTDMGIGGDWKTGYGWWMSYFDGQHNSAGAENRFLAGYSTVLIVFPDTQSAWMLLANQPNVNVGIIGDELARMALGSE
jgi:CubicO group peptidase (beta-lactamase class C family)